MSEPEDLVVDAARHATVFIRETWRRHYGHAPDEPVPLSALTQRLDLLIAAACGTSLPIRVALAPARPTVLHRLFRAPTYPRHRQALPATNGHALWLPAHLGVCDPVQASRLYRAMALQQAFRALRGSAQAILAQCEQPLVRDLALVLEAAAAEEAVARQFPGLIRALVELRQLALAARPLPAHLAPARRPLELQVRELLERDLDRDLRRTTPSVENSINEAKRRFRAWDLPPAQLRGLGPMPLFRDWWTGELRVVNPGEAEEIDGSSTTPNEAPKEVRTARMQRRPEEREATPDEDQPGDPGVWMIQQDSPHEIAEDPFGLQRPVDRDDETSADEFGDMLSELASTRMVAAPDPPREVLLSDDPPDSRARVRFDDAGDVDVRFRYPEWDYARETYIQRGTTVHISPAIAGELRWVEATLARHRLHLDGIRRQFEALRPERVRLRRQAEGEDIDLDACVEARVDLRAGGSAGEGLYESRRPGRRSISVCLLVDVSGSTDAFIGAGRRVIDVEREALLLVCMALESLGEPFCVIAFSGEGPHGVALRTIKAFDEPYGEPVALRIAGLEPDRYTRAGAALRHAATLLMQQPAEHRLLLMLSDGKPNDADRYEGRFGVEDMRQAVTEARLQGIFPFCLTVDLQAPRYLPKVFGAANYALLSTPERLPLVLLDWTRQLLAR